MEESDSSRNSSYCRSDSDESTSTFSSTEQSEDLSLSLPLSLPTGVSPYRFEPAYDPGEEPSATSVALPTDTEDPEVSRVGNSEWLVDIMII